MPLFNMWQFYMHRAACPMRQREDKTSKRGRMKRMPFATKEQALIGKQPVISMVEIVYATLFKKTRYSPPMSLHHKRSECNHVVIQTTIACSLH